jgi:hypothetical protein
MFLLLTDALLFLMLMIGLGRCSQLVLSRLFSTPVYTGTMGLLLSGIVTSSIYFNLLSFWLPVNYWSLLPLAAVSLVYLFGRNRTGFHALTAPLRGTPWIVPGILLLILFYSSLPCTFTDSETYHFETISWYESYKVIPGLANLHGRFAYNPCSFIIQSAFAFTGLAGQSIYPVNPAITGMFLLWIAGRIVRTRTTYACFAYMLFFILACRALLAYVNTPNSDSLYTICVGYATIRFFETLLAEELSLSTMVVPLLIALYAPISKLTALPILALIPYALFLLPAGQRKRRMLPAFFLIAGLIYLPWIGRTFVMSGHLLYPVPVLDIFHPDWKVPDDVFRIDYDHIRYTPIKHIASLQELSQIQKQKPWQWFLPWAIGLYTQFDLKIVITLLFAGLFSPLLWIISSVLGKKPRGRFVLVWLVVYFGLYYWLVGSPEFRFGNIYIFLAVFLPVLYWTYARPLPKGKFNKFNRVILCAFFVLVTLNYIRGAFFLRQRYLQKFHYGFTARNWLYPLKDYNTTINNDKATFRYKKLNAGVKLYLSDDSHDCLNADLPCLIWNYGEIEMRGDRIEDGFRNVKCDAWTHFPFL